MKISQSPQGKSQQVRLLNEDLNQTKETLAIQNEGIERMQNLLQNKDDEIDKLREALDEMDDAPVGFYFLTFIFEYDNRTFLILLSKI